MANSVIQALIEEKITKSGDSDRISDTEVRQVLNEINSFIQDDISYSATIPFTKLSAKMAAHTISGAITFIKNTTNAIPGAGVLLELTADGTNEPDFSDFTKAPNSQDYDNTNGAVHKIAFFYDGGDYYYSIYDGGTNPSSGSATVNGDVEEFAGDGLTTTFNIPHGLGSTPVSYSAQAASPEAQGISYVTADNTNVHVHYELAPISSLPDVVAIAWTANL